MKPQIDLGAARVPGGYFLLRPHQSSPFAKPMRSQREADQFCFTYRGSRRSIETELLQMIRLAKQKIFITSFRIGDAGLLEALYAAATKLRGGVYVITALDDRSLSEGLKDLDETDRPGETPTLESLKANFAEMTRHGIYVRGHSSCHAKFVVVDDAVALVSSANLETAALRDGRKRGATGECGVVVRAPHEVNRLARFFTRLWHEGCDWEVPAGVSYRVSKRTPVASPCSVPPPDPSSGLSVIWTDQRENFILLTLQDIIGLARRDLLLASFSLCEMSAHSDLLLGPIQTAIQERGVRVRMLIRGRNNVGTHCADAERFLRLGVEIFADSLNHAKGVIADGRDCALFSANFDAQHGLTNGVETGVRITDSAAVRDARDYFEHAMEHSDLQFTLDPDSRTLDRRLAAGWRKPWGSRTAIAIRAEEHDWQRLSEQARDNVTLFEERSVDDLNLWCGTTKWRLQQQDDRESFQLTDAQTAPVSSPILLRTWMSQLGRRRASSPTHSIRGICPAVVTWQQAQSVERQPEKIQSDEP